MSNIIDGLYVKAGKPLDKKYGPYNSLLEANQKILMSERYNGLMFGVYTNPNDLNNSSIIEYYYYGNLSNNSIKMKMNIIVSETPPENPNINDIWLSY